jgi:solute carrier family 15 (oligopeptide transporter), member 1
LKSFLKRINFKTNLSIKGAIIADGFLGRYRTILYVSCLYCFGVVILTLTSITPLGAPNLYGAIFSLFLIAIGTGGIKFE